MASSTRWTVQQLTSLTADELAAQLRTRITDTTDLDGFWAATTAAPELVSDAITLLLTQTSALLAETNASADLADPAHQSWRRTTNRFRHQLESRLATLRPYRDAARARRSQVSALGESLALRRALRTLATAVRTHELACTDPGDGDRELWTVLGEVDMPQGDELLSLRTMVTTGPWAPVSAGRPA